MIEPRVEPGLHGHLRTKAVELGTTVFAVNGMPDHVHVVASVPPKVALADFVGQVKGFSSHEINRDMEGRFQWQVDYGVFSFDRKRLPNYVEYVENQKRHHAEKATIGILERTSGSPASEVREPAVAYNDEAWRQELESLETAE